MCSVPGLCFAGLAAILQGFFGKKALEKAYEAWLLWLDGREQAAKAYANQAYEQPYNTAMYTAGVLLEARRWHMAEYEAVVGDLSAEDLTV